LHPADRGLILEITYGLVRWQSTLDWLIARKARDGVQGLPLQILLRLGLYQIFWLDRIPDHAAVHETVELTREMGFGRQAGFVNAILRAYLREKAPTLALLEELKTSQPALGYSHPEWLCNRWGKLWDRDTVRRLLEWNNAPAPVYARLNTLKTHAATLQETWTREGVEFEIFAADWTAATPVFKLTSHPSLATLPSFRNGFFYIQDPSTHLAVHVLDPQPGESILDACAAPGGKTTHIAQHMQNRGYVMAQDLDIHRRTAIRENCDRLGVSIVTISRATTAIRSELSKPFDKVLVDTPCSNTGVMRRRVDLKWRLSPEELARLKTVQRKILRQASLQVKPGGLLVYSTCSLEPQENQDAIRDFLRRFPRFHLEQERQLLPFIDGVDGAYVAALRNRAGETPE
jgi:16S rRNA (cytosine967-C5)-methyltransferase